MTLKRSDREISNKERKMKNKKKFKTFFLIFTLSLSAHCFGPGREALAGVHPASEAAYRLGILFTEIDPYFAESHGLDKPFGIYVEQIDLKDTAGELPEGPRKEYRRRITRKYRDTGALKPRDIIIKANHREVRGAKDLAGAIAERADGDLIELVVWRGGREFALKAPLYPSPYTAYPVIGHETSFLYHRLDARHAPANGKRFAHRALAEEQHFQPCRICFSALPSADQLTDLEKSIGGGIVREIKSKYPIDSKAQSEGLVRRVGNALGDVSRMPGRSYRFSILKTDQINAHASPSGEVFVHEGLLRTCETEEELAFVLAHEISHIVEGHHAQQHNNLKTQQRFIGALGAVAQAAIGDPIIGAGIDSGATLFNYLLKHGYSRKQEKEADLSALAYLMKAGIDVRKALVIVAKLEEAEEREESVRQTFGSNHPTPGDRLIYLAEAYERWSRGEIKIRDDSDETRPGLRAGKKPRRM